MRFLASTRAAYVGSKALLPHRSGIGVGLPVKRKPQHENVVAAHIRTKIAGTSASIRRPRTMQYSTYMRKKKVFIY